MKRHTIKSNAAYADSILTRPKSDQWYKNASGRVEVTDSPIDYAIGGVGKSGYNIGRRLLTKGTLVDVDGHLAPELMATWAGISLNSMRKFKLAADEDMAKNVPSTRVKAVTGRLSGLNTDAMDVNKHAYGSKIRSKWNGGDWGTFGAAIGSGALSGAAIGAPAGGIGAIPGAIIGGVIGGVGGLLGTNSQAKERARLEEENRQTTLENMENRLESDSVIANGEDDRSMSFYLRGGRMMSRRKLALGGSYEPVSTDTAYVDGPSHEQGGVSAGANDEVEGGEMIKNNMGSDGEVASTDVYSKRLVNPQSGRSFAEDAFELSVMKGKLQKQFAFNEKNITKEREAVSGGNVDTLKLGSAKRRAQIAATKNEQILAQIQQIDDGLKQLFDVQQEVNGDSEGQSEMAYGGKIEHAPGGKIMKDLYNTSDNRYDPWVYGKDWRMTLDNGYPVKDSTEYDLEQVQPDLPKSVSRSIGGMRRTFVPTPEKGFNNLPQQFKDQVAYTAPNPSDVVNTPVDVTFPYKGTRFTNATPQDSERFQKALDTAPLAEEGGSGIGQLGLQAGAQILDTVGQAITANQMSNLPVPTRRRVRPGLFNTYVDNSADINDITANAGATKEFVVNNIKGAQARRNAILNVMSKENQAKSKSFATKFAMERELENKNVEQMYRNDVMNNEAVYQNNADKYNAAMSGLNRQSQIVSNFADKTSQLVTAKAQLDQNDLDTGLVLSKFPADVRRRVMQQMGKGRSLSTAIKIEGTN